MDEWMDGWMDEWMGGLMDGWMDENKLRILQLFISVH